VKTYDRASSLFWLCYSIFILVESLRLGIGKLHAPGMGFMAFGSSGLLAILSLVLLVRSSSRKGELQIQPIFTGTLWTRALFVMIALLIYSKLLPVAGYLISTFLLMSFLFWIVERQKVWRVLILSFLTTLGTYYVFSKWLNCQFPEGLLRL
jgi:Tripartite tricarboxylate transporter TctB family